LNRRAAIACLLLSLLAFPTGGTAHSEEQGTAGIRLNWTPKGLIAAHASASPARRRLIERALRAHGTAALPALRAALEGGVRQAPWRRLVSTITVDFHRAHVPDGMVYIPAGHLEIPRKKRPWGPSGKRQWVRAFYLDRHEVTVEAWRAPRRNWHP